MQTLVVIFFSSALTNNIALTYFLGMCPFIAISKNAKAASGMGMAVTYVMLKLNTKTRPVAVFSS